MEYREHRELAIEAARAAGEIIRAAWHRPRSVAQKKGEADLVTQTDEECEACVLGRIRERFGDSHKFIGEEGSAAQGFTSELTDEPTWICDPLDGTTNFVHQFPFVCTCIGFAVNKQVVVGVVYAPILNELFVAVRGQGATLNGAPITVSAETDLAKALLATEVGVTRDAETVAAIFDRVQRCAASTRSVRATGSCAMNMCSVAMGRLDAFYEVGFGGPWDVAGASLIVEEAGGVLSNMQAEGAPFDITTRRVLCGAPALVPQIAAVVRESKISPHEP